MAVTPNNTLPDIWDDSITYVKDDSVSYYGIIYKSKVDNNINHNPHTETDYWTPINVYLKELTVMPHGDYSGDESFWERDNIYIDSSGYVYVNNENTGINVNGKLVTEINFKDLTEEEKDLLRRSLKGDKGDKGDQGIQGPVGPQGPAGTVTLTDEQIAVLKGDEGKSAYQSWLDTGHSGTENDFVSWLRSGVITLDKELNPSSLNGIENQAITNAFLNYQRHINELLHQYESRLIDLENRLKYTYGNQEYTFGFGITENGQYGYRINNSNYVVPFNPKSGEQSSMSVEPSNLLSVLTIGQTSPLTVETILPTDELQPTSLLGDVSDRSIKLTQNVYSSFPNEVVANNFDKGFSNTAIIKIYEEGIFVSNQFPFNLNSMNFDYPSEPIKEQIPPTDLYTKGKKNYEGLWFDPHTIGDAGHTLYIEVEPYMCDSVKCVLGTTIDLDANFRELVTDSSKNILQVKKTINEKTELSIDILSNQKVYLSTNNTKYQFKINKICIG